ncbi:hypothetical protein E3V19_09365 [Streptococcus pseudopneumoniae]|nr:hypothetical protein E3V19_09365 [Streptococcus pseudopneumoniae]
MTKKLVIGRIGIVVKTNNFFLVTGMPTCHSRLYHLILRRPYLIPWYIWIFRLFFNFFVCCI